MGERERERERERGSWSRELGKSSLECDDSDPGLWIKIPSTNHVQYTLPRQTILCI